MGCGGALLKVFSALYSAVLTIIGLGSVLYGSFVIYIFYKHQPVETRDSELLAIPAATLFILGVILLIALFLGCCALCREASACMEVYSVVLIVLGLLHIALGLYSVMHYSRQETIMNLSLRYQMDLEEIRRSGNLTLMDPIQEGMECCGIDGPEEYYNNFPMSCCDQTDMKQACYSENLFPENCNEALVNVTVGVNIVVGYMSIGAGIVEIVGALLGFCVSCFVWRKQTYSYA